MKTGLVSQTLAEEITQGIRATPAWLKLDDASRCYGICRSGLYSLIRDGRIKSACLRDRNKSRGSRIVNVKSLEDYISAHEDVWSEQVPDKKNGGEHLLGTL